MDSRTHPPRSDAPLRSDREEAPRQTEERFQRLLEKTVDGILVLSPDGVIRYANPAAEALFGRGPGELLETPFGFPVVGGEATDVEVLRRGEPRPVEMRVVEAEWEGQPALLVTLHDLDLRRTLEVERRAAEVQARELGRLLEQDLFKTQFINTSAHELGTPLTPIRLQLHLLRHTYGRELTPEARHSIEVLERNVNRLSRLIHDMLQVARIQAGRIQLDLRETDLVAVAKDALDTFREPARAADVTLQAQASGPLPIRADAARLAQVFDNLLDNALKFTPAGGSILVACRAEGGRAVVEVSDTGRGMRPEALPRLFQAYSQIHDPSQGLQRGSGLGLYICKGIVEAHGGSIRAASAGLGQGSTFRFDLPLLQA